GDRVAAGGSKFKAVNNRERNVSKGKIASRLAHLEAEAGRYIGEAERIDRQESGEARAETAARLTGRYPGIRREIERLPAMEKALDDAPDGQISLTDPDARAMAARAQHRGHAGYYVQSVVDAAPHLIVTHEVATQGHDRDLLTRMGKQARDVTERDEMHIPADKGYFSAHEILACHEAAILDQRMQGGRSEGSLHSGR
ncbi:IS5/IS1182 family transposase, partial [Paracoccus sp. IB05]|nr:IS5/IS1182 family transposase [Paracoccus sp. IB05]